MPEVCIDVEQISNLKHRAVVQALLTTSLTIKEITEKLQIKRSLLYYIVYQYLPRGYLQARKNSLQLEELQKLTPPSTSPAPPASESSEDDEVTILSISSENDIASASDCTPDSESAVSDCATDDSVQQSSAQASSQSEFSESSVPPQPGSSYSSDQHQSPPEAEASDEVTVLTLPSGSDTASAWLDLHPEHRRRRRRRPPLHISQTSAAGLTKEYSQRMTEVSLEYKGAKITWVTLPEDRDASIIRILQGI